MFAHTLQLRLSRGSATGMYHCALENTTVFGLRAKLESVIATDHELSVGGVRSRDPVSTRRNFFVHIALSYSNSDFGSRRGYHRRAGIVCAPDVT